MRSQQRIVATVEESVLKTEMTGLESQEEDSHWQTFFSTPMGAQIPSIAEKPLATCGCRKFQLDPLGDHLNTCTSHSGVKKAHDWMVDQLADLFLTTHRVKRQHVVKNRGQHCGDI